MRTYTCLDLIGGLVGNTDMNTCWTMRELHNTGRCSTNSHFSWYVHHFVTQWSSTPFMTMNHSHSMRIDMAGTAGMAWHARHTPCSYKVNQAIMPRFYVKFTEGCHIHRYQVLQYSTACIVHYYEAIIRPTIHPINPLADTLANTPHGANTSVTTLRSLRPTICHRSATACHPTALMDIVLN